MEVSTHEDDDTTVRITHKPTGVEVKIDIFEARNQMNTMMESMQLQEQTILSIQRESRTRYRHMRAAMEEQHIDHIIQIAAQFNQLHSAIESTQKTLYDIRSNDIRIPTTYSKVVYDAVVGKGLTYFYKLDYPDDAIHFAEIYPDHESEATAIRTRTEYLQSHFTGIQHIDLNTAYNYDHSASSHTLKETMDILYSINHGANQSYTDESIQETIASSQLYAKNYRDTPSNSLPCHQPLVVDTNRPPNRIIP
jgi:hypothetical protein